jgi:hypothetical protein
MPVWSWFFIAAAVIVAVTLLMVAVLSVTGRRRTERLKKHFGPEYERVVGEAGDQRAGEEELVARERGNPIDDVEHRADRSRDREGHA